MVSRNHKVVEALRGARASMGAAVGAVRSRTSRRARRQLALKDAEIAALRRELTRGDGPRRRNPTAGTPVFFVVGNQKSGTTWLMRTLDAHPEILCRGEGRFFGASWRQKGLKHRDVLRPASSLYNAILDADYLRLWIERSVWSRDDDPDEHLDNLLRMAVDYFLMAELYKTGKRLVGDKSPLLTPDTVREISAIYPEARVIHIIRDGRDAVVSAVHHSQNFGEMRGARTRRKTFPDDPREAGEGVFTKDSLGRMAVEWAARVGRTVEDGPKLLGDNYTEVRYEDLLVRPEEEMARLLGFLGSDSGAEAVKRCVDAASFERLSKGRKRGEEDAASFFRKGVAGDWKNVFTQRDREVFKEEAGALLVRLGYEKDDDW